MTPLLTVATGDVPARHLEASQERFGNELSLVRHRDVAVAWATRSPWIDSHDDGTTLVVLDGRLHNLKAPSTAPAKLLLQRYRDRGIDVAQELLGDFVVVIVDRERNRLLVARDPVGVRPWYLATTTGGHAGASEVATLTSFPGVDTTVNDRIAIEYMAAVEESRGETLYRGIRTLAPGQTWLSGGHNARTHQHHRWDIEPDLEISWSDAVERCRAVFDEAVRCRVVGPATSQLSGGLDSSAVVGTLVLLGGPDLMVGRLLFDGPRADERPYSEAVIEHWGLAAVSARPWIPTEQERWDLAQQLQWPAPEPHFTMFVGLHRELLERRRLDGLTGLGGDDAFVAMGIGSRVVSAMKLRQTAVLRELCRWASKNVRRSWHELLRPTLGYLVAPRRAARTPAWITATAATTAELPRLLHRRDERVTGIDAIDQRIGNLTSGYDASILQSQALIADWMGRRDSHPFLDPRFIGATYALDPSWPGRDGHYRALQVATFEDRLPPVVASRRTKVEFSEIFWPQVLDERVLDQVRTGPLCRLGWLDTAGFDGLVSRAKEGRANAAIPLARCVSLDQWIRNTSA